MGLSLQKQELIDWIIEIDNDALVNKLTSIIFEVKENVIIIVDVYYNRCCKTF